MKYTMAEANGLHIREAQDGDEETVLAMIRLLAEYEHMSDQVTATPQQLRHYLFEERAASVLLAFEGETPIGYTLYFTSFSTFLALPGIYIEDLFIREEYRHKGYGRKLLETVMALGREKGYGRVEWSCLKWNKPSLDFYESVGAVRLDDWVMLRKGNGAI